MIAGLMGWNRPEPAENSDRAPSPYSPGSGEPISANTLTAIAHEIRESKDRIPRFASPLQARAELREFCQAIDSSLADPSIPDSLRAGLMRERAIQMAAIAVRVIQEMPA